MRAPVTGAVLCAIAAVALLVAAFTPWFSTGKEIDARRMRYEEARRARAIALDRYDDDFGGDEEAEAEDVRANFGLVTGEVCIDLECKSAKYTGAKGLADDAFAWLGRGAVGAAMASVVLLIAVALAARTQRRTHLRGWAASVAAIAVGLGAAFAASWPLEELVGYVSRGMGLTAAIAGAAFAGVGVGWPSARGNAAAVKRYGIAAALAILSVLAWVTIVEHGWWKSVKAIEPLRVSPLGVQSCSGDECKLATALGVTASLRSLAVLTSLASAVLLVPAFGAAARIARGVRPGAWGWTAGIVGVCALGAGMATWIVYPSTDAVRVAWGLPVFAVASAGSVIASFAGIALIKDADADVGVHGVAHGHGHAHAPFHHEPVFVNTVAPGERPQLAPLAAANATPVATAVEPSNAVSKYAPSASVAAAAVAAASGRTVVPAFGETQNPSQNQNQNPSQNQNPTLTATSTALGTATVVEPVVIHVADSGSAPAPVHRDPASAPVAVPAVVRPQPTGPAARKATPMCPNCRVATIYSSKRNAWWCSTCKRTL